MPSYQHIEPVPCDLCGEPYLHDESCPTRMPPELKEITDVGPARPLDNPAPVVRNDRAKILEALIELEVRSQNADE